MISFRIIAYLYTLKGQSHGDFPIFFVTILINLYLYQSTLLTHELLLDHQGDNIKRSFKTKTSENLFFEILSETQGQKLEKFYQKFSSRTSFPSWPSLSRHTYYSFHVLEYPF